MSNESVVSTVHRTGAFVTSVAKITYGKNKGLYVVSLKTEDDDDDFIEVTFNTTEPQYFPINRKITINMEIFE